MGRLRNLFRIIYFFFIFILIFGLLFLIAGRIDWYEMWILSITYLVLLTGWIVWLKLKRPGLLKERMTASKKAKKWDRVLILIYTVLLIIFLVLCALDAGRFHWSYVPVPVKIIFFPALLYDFFISFWASYVNRYLSSYVRIQDDRGHQVVKEGPYKFIRHPMYSGIIILIPSLSLFLGSFWGLIPAAFIVCIFLIRTYLEDKTLQDELEGYVQYTKEVPYRLIPLIW